MVIYLRHPQHGRKVATSDLEAKADYANGWEGYDPTQLLVEPVADAVPVNALEGKRRRKTVD